MLLHLLFSPVLLFLLFMVLFLANGIRILKEYERAVVFRLGRSRPALIGGYGPGLIVLIPLLDRMVKVSLRTVTLEVPAQDVITRDNVSVKVNAVIYTRVIDPQKAILQVENYLYATTLAAQTKLRSVLGQGLLDDLLTKREEINLELQKILDQQTEPWGVKVTTVEIKNVDLPQDMMRVIARQAEAERERRAKVISAEGEFQASQRLFDAAQVLAQNPMSLQIKYLGTLMELANNKTTTIVFPVPIDFLSAFQKTLQKEAPVDPLLPGKEPDKREGL
ncbi:MAG: slipin family protein [Leptospirales bacterium]